MERSTGNTISFRLMVVSESEAPIAPVLGQPGQPKNTTHPKDDCPGGFSARRVLVVHWPPGAIATSNKP